MPNDAIILIGPIGAGKSTIGKLLSEKLSLPQYHMDYLRWEYYKEIGYDDQKINEQRDPDDGFWGLYRLWKPFEIHAVERLLADHPEGVIDFGGGHSVYEDDALFERARAALAPFQHVVLILPSEDLDESIRVLRERMPESPEDIHEVNAHFVHHHSNSDLAKIVVYTSGKAPEQTCDEIAQAVSRKNGQ
ncbi:MAG TPA: shikimate kinase [Capsulimonadaceae bacterium]|nr:shikimate kinase [Capsulimonadaceae bacterium]